MSKGLNTQNSDKLFYENDLLRLSVLGGIKLEGLDRMRVTLKVELLDTPRPPVRHNLDLYNDNQLEKFIRKCAEKLEIGTNILAASFSELTEGLEKYRLDKIKEQQAEAPKTRILTPEEREQSIIHLQNENLLDQTLQDLQDTGIQGESENALILFIAMTSRKTKDPLSVICLARSGVGKSYLMEKVSECIPDEDRKEHTQFSGNSFYYYKREEIRGKVFLIEDLDGAQAVLFPIRELQTKKRISKTVTMKDKNGQLRTITLIVEGPVSVIGCTTREKIYEDNANRALLIYMDGSREQDERIMNYQKDLRAGIIDRSEEYNKQQQLQAMQLLLEPIRVINPYAPLIEIPQEIFKPRRTLPLLLSFIEAITFYHQYQREQKSDKQTGEIFIEVHPRDIEQGFKLLNDVLFRKSDELSGAAREFYQWLIEWVNTNNKKHFFASEIRQGPCPSSGGNRIHPRTLNRYLQELNEYGLLQITGGNKYKTGYTYKITSNGSYENLQKSINQQIEKVLQRVWKEHEKREGETVSKPLDSKASVRPKAKRVKGKEPVGQNH